MSAAHEQLRESIGAAILEVIRDVAREEIQAAVKDSGLHEGNADSWPKGSVYMRKGGRWYVQYKDPDGAWRHLATDHHGPTQELLARAVLERVRNRVADGLVVSKACTDSELPGLKLPMCEGVYALQIEPGVVKIGWSKCIADRCCQIQKLHHRPLSLIAWFDGGELEERILHDRFMKLRIRGEFFSLEGDLLELVKCRHEELGNVGWQTASGAAL